GADRAGARRAGQRSARARRPVPPGDRPREPGDRDRGPPRVGPAGGRGRRRRELLAHRDRARRGARGPGRVPRAGPPPAPQRVWPPGQIVLTGGPPVGPVSFEAGQLPPRVRPPPVVLEQEGSPTWTCSPLPPGTWTVRWQGRVVGAVELEPQGDEPALARLPWP